MRPISGIARWAAAPVLALVFAGAIPGPALAAPIYLDFSDAALYGGATGFSTFGPVNDQGVIFTLSSTGGTLMQSIDGIGVNGPTSLDDPSEIGITELFAINFVGPHFIESVYFNHFYTNDPLPGHNERGQYSINNGAFIPFSANSASGLFELHLNTFNVSSLRFTVPSGFSTLLDDYSIDGVSVPEPATLLMFGAGLFGVARARRRFSA